MSQFLEVAVQAARAGGKILLDYQQRIVAREKGPRDLVSEADLASQQCIRQLLLGAFPDHAFLGEEDDPQATASSESEYRWIVDPLDGTTNYIHRLQTFAVSIGLEHRGEMIAGVVLDPVANECFTAERGQGAQLNGQPIHVSKCQRAGDALVAVGFAPLVKRDSPEVTRFLAALEGCQAVRRLGSAALNLAYLAAGRLDSYWASSVKIWDVAAGVLIVREAGGVVTHLHGGPLNLNRPELLASATASLHAEMLPIVK